MTIIHVINTKKILALQNMENFSETSLDGLPQVFNVLENEMSFICHRPYMLNEENKIGNIVKLSFL